MQYYHFDKISSTNDFTKELLKNEPSVMVTADFQWKGKGRNNRIWFGDYGINVYCSIGIRHDKPLKSEKLMIFQVIGCLATKKSLVELTNNNDFRIKYPNDIFAKCQDEKYRKLSGVLTEHGFTGKNCEYSIVGIGINVGQMIFPPEIRNEACSLKLLGYDFKPDDFYPLVRKFFLEFYGKNQDEIFKLWKNELSIEGKLITLTDENIVLEVEKLLENGSLSAREIVTKEIRLIDNGNTIRYNLE